MSQHAPLAPDPEERTFDIERRVGIRRLVNSAAILLAVFGSVPWLGWDAALVAPFVAVALVASDRLAHSSSRPELVIFAGFVATMLGAGGFAALSGGVKSPALALVVVPIFGVALRFQGRLLIAGLIGCVLTAIAACVAPSPDAFLANPTPLFFVLAAMVTIGSVTEATQPMETHHRAQAVIDPLTGLFNRSSLTQRFYVLVDVAYTMREVLRHGDLVYRLGGEEFVILLPGRSFGVATWSREQSDWTALYAVADARLYEPKQASRNLVRPAPRALPPPAPVLAAAGGGRSSLSGP
jgi:Diguanylate cyclase, GGDEF domain